MKDFADYEIRQMLAKISGERCVACTEVIDYHTTDSARRCLKEITKRWPSITRMVWQGAAIGSGAAGIMVLLVTIF